MFFFEIMKAIIFGIVEGVTEWLPVSSTGHMLLLDGILRLEVSDSFYRVFEVVVQLGAVAAVIVKFRDRIIPQKGAPHMRPQVCRLWRLILVGVLPSAVAGYFFDDLIEKLFYTPTVVAITLIFYGLAFIAAELFISKRATTINDIHMMDNKRAATVGLFQTLALIPGTSRSGATILGAYLLGASRSVAAEFSFLLAIPTMLGAGFLRVVKFIIDGNFPSGAELLLLAVGTAVAYAVSRIVVELLVDLVRRRGFIIFGIYRIILGGVILLLLAE